MTLKVVYIDDEPDLCSLFEDNFVSKDIEIKTYSDPQRALKDMTSYRTDLVFIDFRLPKCTGEDIAKALDPLIPKILVTGDILVKTNYPFFKIFSKPYKTEDIQQILNHFLTQHQDTQGPST